MPSPLEVGSASTFKLLPLVTITPLPTTFLALESADMVDESLKVSSGPITKCLAVNSSDSDVNFIPSSPDFKISIEDIYLFKMKMLPYTADNRQKA